MSRYKQTNISRFHLALCRQSDEEARERRLALGAPLGGGRCSVFALRAERFNGMSRRYEKVRVKSYAHGRIVLTASVDGQGFCKGASKYRATGKVAAVASNLVLCRETPPSLKVGGRWRIKPLTTKFTSHARNLIRDAAEVIQDMGSGVPFLLTLTLPGQGEKFDWATSVMSGYLVNRFNRFIKQFAEGGRYGYCWEVQRRGTAHLHYVMRIPRGEVSPSLYNRVRDAWNGILEDASLESGFNLWSLDGAEPDLSSRARARVNFKVVKKHVGKYLSKYLSKTKSKSGAISGFCPGRWIGISSEARQEVIARRETFEVLAPMDGWADQVLDYLSLVAESLALPVVLYGRKHGAYVPVLSIQLTRPKQPLWFSAIKRFLVSGGVGTISVPV